MRSSGCAAGSRMSRSSTLTLTGRRPLLPFMHDATKRELLQSVDHVVAGLAELRAEVVTKMVTGASGRAVTGRGDAGSEGAETLA